MRALLAPLLLLALLLGAAGARAQGSGGVAFPSLGGDTARTGIDTSRVVRDSLGFTVDTTQVNFFAKTPRDSTGAPFHYNTGYNINRNLSTWSQVLNVDTKWKLFHIDNATNTQYREDTERHQRTAQRTEDLKVDFLGPRALTVGLALNLERNNDGPVVGGSFKPTSSYTTTNARLTLGDSLYLRPDNVLYLGLEGGHAAHDEVAGGARSNTGQDLVQKASYTFSPNGPLKFQLTESNNTVKGTGVGQTAGRDTSFSTSNHDFNLGMSGKLQTEWNRLGLTWSGTHTATQLQQPAVVQDTTPTGTKVSVNKLETVSQTADNADGSVTGLLGRFMNLNIGAHTSHSLVNSDVDSTKSYDTRTRSGNVTAEYKLPVLGSFNSSINDQISTNDYRKRVSGSLQDVTEHTVTTQWTRQMGRGFNATVNLAGDLRATRYSGRDTTQNQDYLNRRIGGSLAFTPEGLPVTLTFQASQVMNHYVYLDPHQSGKNSIDQLYSVEYDVAYRRGTQFDVTQSYIVSADVNISDFENVPYITADNRYIKSTNYLTTLHDWITPRVQLEVSHNLRLTRSGTYDLDAFGNRFFGESNRGQTNDLNLKVSYKFTPWLSGVMQNRTQFIHSGNLDFSGNVVPTSRERIMEFNAGVTLGYNFSERTRLNGVFSRSARFDHTTPYVSGHPQAVKTNDQDYYLIQSSLDIVFD